MKIYIFVRLWIALKNSSINQCSLHTIILTLFLSDYNQYHRNYFETTLPVITNSRASVANVITKYFIVWNIVMLATENHNRYTYTLHSKTPIQRAPRLPENIPPPLAVKGIGLVIRMHSAHYLDTFKKGAVKFQKM